MFLHTCPLKIQTVCVPVPNTFVGLMIQKSPVPITLAVPMTDPPLPRVRMTTSPDIPPVPLNSGLIFVVSPDQGLTKLCEYAKEKLTVLSPVVPK